MIMKMRNSILLRIFDIHFRSQCWKHSLIAHSLFVIKDHIDELVQERRNSIANAPELRFFALTDRYYDSYHAKVMYQCSCIILVFPLGTLICTHFHSTIDINKFTPQTVMLGRIPPSVYHGGARKMANHGMPVSSEIIVTLEYGLCC